MRPGPSHDQQGSGQGLDTITIGENREKPTGMDSIRHGTGKIILFQQSMNMPRLGSKIREESEIFVIRFKTFSSIISLDELSI